MRSLDEEIARKLAEASDAGELAHAEGFGKPLAEDDGWNETPAALRLPFKILKDAGVVPREIEMFRERAELSRQLAECVDLDQQRIIAQRLNDLEQAIALRLEALRINRSL